MKFGFKHLVGLLIGAVLIGGTVIWLGLYNVAANEKHWGVTNIFLELVRDRSIIANAEDLPVPDLTDDQRIARGAPNYAAMCAQCHLAPGVESSELHEGLYPQPPNLNDAEHAAQNPQESFWIIKNGLKMTGMPAWGINNSDDQIWDMIALIAALDAMSVEKYQSLVASGEHTHAKGGHATSDAPQPSASHHGNSGSDEGGTSTSHHGSSGGDEGGTSASDHGNSGGGGWHVSVPSR